MEPTTVFAWIVPLWQMLIEVACAAVSCPAVKAGLWYPGKGLESQLLK